MRSRGRRSTGQEGPHLGYQSVELSLVYPLLFSQLSLQGIQLQLGWVEHWGGRSLRRSKCGTGRLLLLLLLELEELL